MIGAGTIGRAWAMLFAGAGHRVRLFDADADSAAAAVESVGRMSADSGTAATGQVTAARSLVAAVEGASVVLECVVESLQVKRAVFAELDQLAPPSTVLATSSSTMTMSCIAGQLAGRNRCLVLHPANPPYLLRVVEVVPAPFTDAKVVEAACVLLRGAGVRPVVLSREIDGFVFNRLQGALLREAWCLVRDGIVSTEDVDALVTEGLGRRWAVSGPFATSELNTRGGIEQHSRTIGRAYARMAAERGADDPWTDSVIETVAAQVHRRLPHEQWAEQVQRREQFLAVLREMYDSGQLDTVPTNSAPDESESASGTGLADRG